MAKLVAKLLKLFGQDGSASNFEQFGSTVNGAANLTKDIDTIQSLSAWVTGWTDAVYGANKAPVLEDMNALCYVMSYMQTYMFQEGIPEYLSTRTYYIGSIVKKTGTSELYKSITDNNLGNALPSKADNSNWQYVINKGILQYDSTYSYSIGEIVQKPGTAELYKSLTNSNVGNALPAQVSTAIWQYLVDLANITPPPVGVSSIKFGFINVSVTGTPPQSSSTAKVPTTDFGFDSDMAVYAFIAIAQSSLNINASGSPTYPGFSFGMTQEATLTGAGVIGGMYLLGGSPANAYTLTLSTSLSTTIGSGSIPTKAVAIFIGIK